MDSTDKTSGPRGRRLHIAGLNPLLTWSALVGVAFALHLGWEYAQSPLYGEHDGPSLPWSIFFRAAVVDALIIAAVTAAALLVRSRWRSGFWVVLVAALTAIAAGIELHARFTGRWSYGAAMPMVGLTPLAQLPLLGAVVNVVVRPWRTAP